jgi:hypothetical protein
MIPKNKFKPWTVFFSLLLTLFIQPASHATDVMQFKVLAAKPLPGTDIGV